MAKHAAIQQARAVEAEGGARTASGVDADVIDWVVDQDAQDPCTVPLPSASVPSLRLDPAASAAEATRPPSLRPPAPLGPALEATAAAERIDPRLTPAMRRLRAWLEAAGDAHASLAEQAAAWCGAMLDAVVVPGAGSGRRLVFASRVLREDPDAAAVVADLIEDAERAVRLYNRALTLHPEAGVGFAFVGREAVELPLWWLAPSGRVAVWVELGRGRRLVDAAGEAVPADAVLAPRALLMTALARRVAGAGGGACAFVHGLGGWRYDAAMETWWHHWRGETLVPRLMATADLRLGPSPRSAAAEHTRALWWRHHLRHHPELDPRTGWSDTDRAAWLRLQHGPRHARRRAFRGMHREIRSVHDAAPAVLGEAEAAVHASADHLSRARLLHRRTWPVFCADSGFKSQPAELASAMGA